MTIQAVIAPKKLIEVALPLDDINKAAAREKSIRHGHPSTLHLWWARRPLAAARAILFAQLVNDPSWKYSEEEIKKPQIRSAITRKRNELFRLISELVSWENTTNARVLARANAEIRSSWRETCDANRAHPDAASLFDPDNPPAFHDPFAGGGAIPLEAQRLGLLTRATDLNPVAVVINKAMIEIPARFAGRPPIGPKITKDRQTKSKVTEDWSGTRGLAEDVRRYGAWMRDETLRRVGKNYAPVTITKDQSKTRPDLKRYEGKALSVIAWLWSRTVTCPNPACQKVTPLLTSFVLAQKPGKERYLKVETRKGKLAFEVVSTPPVENPEEGLKRGMSGIFECAHCKSVTTRDYVAKEGVEGRIGAVATAIVAEGERERIYLSAPDSMSPMLLGKLDTRGLDVLFADNPRDVWCRNFGLLTPKDLFTARQLTTLLTMVDVIADARELVLRDANAAWKGGDSKTLESGGAGPRAYSEAIGVYLAFALDKATEATSTLCTWSSAPKNELVVSTFRRHAIPMTWDFAETNPFGDSSGSLTKLVEFVARVVEHLPTLGAGPATATQDDAREFAGKGLVISTDPPYYDNIGYGDIADYFYGWLRRTVGTTFPALFGTMSSPKREEIVALSYRHENRDAAEAYFLDGMKTVMKRVAEASHPALPVTLYYAFKQSETSDSETVSTGWETFLEAVLQSNLALVGTWPVRTERGGRSVGIGTNALASSVVLVCRPRRLAAASVSRRDFLRELEQKLPLALSEMTADPIASIAPVDLEQASIGPGMAIYSQYKAVVEADGSPMTVHDALIHINKAIDDFFSHAEGDLDADTRFCISWYQQYGLDAAAFGDADVLARAKGTSVKGLEDAGVLLATKGRVRLYATDELPDAWDPTKDNRVPIWEACHHMCRALEKSEGDAGSLLARMPEKQESIRLLAYRLYTLCGRKGWAEKARAYNELIISWPAIIEASRVAGVKGTQMELI